MKMMDQDVASMTVILRTVILKNPKMNLRSRFAFKFSSHS